MKCFVPEISWHNRDPVLSVDIQPKTDKNEAFYRLASGGADSHVVIWYVKLQHENESGQFAALECAADLQRHQKSVNVVRFSPNGQFLASGDDDGVIIIWKMRVEQDPPELPGGESDKDKESWLTMKILRGHLQDIYDLAWSPDSASLVSGSIDNTAIMWDVEKGKSLCILGDHKGFVQGVAWDPKGKFIATLSTDRNLRVFDSVKKRQVARASKCKLPASITKDKEKDKENKDEKERLNKLYHNDTLKTFFRRLNFSPNGDLLVTPCGVLEEDGGNVDVSYVYTRSSFNKPALHLPSPKQYTVAVRFSPLLYKTRGCTPPLFALPYRAVYAIATRSTLILYDSEQTQPFGFVSNIHYTGLTDITWSPDGRLIIVSSSEGYCSVITFDKDEIGVPVDREDPAKPTVVDSTKEAPIEKKETEKPASEVESKDPDVITIDSSSEEKMEVDTPEEETKIVATPEKDKVSSADISPIDTTPKKKVESGSKTFKTPERRIGAINQTKNMASPGLDDSQNSCISDLSLCLDEDEGELISKEEQARRLMSPYRGSPRASSPSARSPNRAAEGSPRTPRGGRRVALITLTSPKSKRKL